MALKKNALDPAERKKECTHELGFSYTGTIPCTGPKVCYMCGTRQDDNDMDMGTDRQRETRQPEQAHTPGPWTNASGSVWKGDPFADPEGAYKIGGADRDTPRTLPVERDANVQLMAAAPRLLTALRNLVNDFDESVLTTEPMLIEARDAIDAATT